MVHWQSSCLTHSSHRPLKQLLKLQILQANLQKALTQAKYVLFAHQCITNSFLCFTPLTVPWPISSYTQAAEAPVLASNHKGACARGSYTAIVCIFFASMHCLFISLLWFTDSPMAYPITPSGCQRNCGRFKFDRHTCKRPWHTYSMYLHPSMHR